MFEYRLNMAEKWWNTRIQIEQIQDGDHIYHYIRKEVMGVSFKTPIQHHAIVISVFASPGPYSISDFLENTRILEVVNEEGFQGIRESSLLSFLTSDGKHEQANLHRVSYGKSRKKVMYGGSHAMECSPTEDVLKRGTTLKELWDLGSTEPESAVALKNYDLLSSNCEQFAIFCKTG